MFEGALGGESKHEAGDSAEEHADANECSDYPYGAGRPRAPDHDGQDESDGGVNEQPAGSVAGTDLEELEDLEHAFKEEIDGDEEGKGNKAGDGVEDHIDAGEEIGGAEEQLPDNVAGVVGLEGEDEVSDGADEEKPAQEEGYSDAGDHWQEEGDESGDDEQDAEKDRPANGFGDEVRERGGGGAHKEDPPKDVEAGPDVGWRIA